MISSSLLAKPSIDLATAIASSSLLLLSTLAAVLVLLFFLRASRSRSHLHIHLLGFNSLYPVRLLLLLFSSLWSLSELLRLPFISIHLPFSPAVLCRGYLICSQALAEPAFFATLLFLLRASTHHPKSPSPSTCPAFAAALLAALAASLPFIILHAVFLFFPPSSPDVFGIANYVVGDDTARCGYPLFTTVLQAGLGAVYVPLFVSASWAAVTVVINKTLRLRLYVLAAAVVVALSVQVSALALSALVRPDGVTTQVLVLVAFLAVWCAVVAGEGILVIRPVVDALTVVEPQLGVCSSLHGSVDVEEG